MEDDDEYEDVLGEEEDLEEEEEFTEGDDGASNSNASVNSRTRLDPNTKEVLPAPGGKSQRHRRVLGPEEKV